MKRCPLGPTPQRVSPVARFHSAEEAWFWFVRCHQLRRDGGRMQRAVLSAARPCDPDDIYRWVKALRETRRIGAAHLATLERYGLAGRTPDPSVSRIVSVVQKAVTTGGTLAVEIGGVAVDGLAVTVADSAAAGDVDTDGPSAPGHATAAIAADGAIEIVPASFATAGALNGYVEIAPVADSD